MQLVSTKLGHLWEKSWNIFQHHGAYGYVDAADIGSGDVIMTKKHRLKQNRCGLLSMKFLQIVITF